MAKKHCCYILQSLSNGKVYTGYTTDNIGPFRRLNEHNRSKTKGAKYTRQFGGRPWRLICFIEGFRDKSHAMSAEWAIKKCSSFAPILKEISQTKVKNKNLDKRIQALFTVMLRERVTKKAIETASCNYRIIWFIDEYEELDDLIPYCECLAASTKMKELISKLGI